MRGVMPLRVWWLSLTWRSTNVSCVESTYAAPTEDSLLVLWSLLRRSSCYTTANADLKARLAS